jgi:hypothetical protein
VLGDLLASLPSRGVEVHRFHRTEMGAIKGDLSPRNATKQLGPGFKLAPPSPRTSLRIGLPDDGSAESCPLPPVLAVVSRTKKGITGGTVTPHTA